MKRIIALVIIAVVAATSVIALTGCSARTNGNAAGLPNTVTRTVSANDAYSAGDEGTAAAAVSNQLYVDTDTQQSADDPTFTIAVRNIDTGEASSVIASYADDRYDVVSGYFWLPEGNYDLAVYTYNPAGGNTSLCACGSCYVDWVGESGLAPVRVNYSPIMSEVDAEMG